jgi:hypothetical protein
VELVLQYEEYRNIRRIVVHGAARDIAITADRFGTGGLTAAEAAALEGEVAHLLTDFARKLGVRVVPFTGQMVFTKARCDEGEMELLFALSALNSSARLYTHLVKTSDDRLMARDAGESYAAQVKLVDSVLQRVDTPRTRIVKREWRELNDSMEHQGIFGAR